MVHSQGQQQSQQAKQRNERGDRFRLSAGRVSAPHLPHLPHLVATTCTSCLGRGNDLCPEHIPTIIIAQHSNVALTQGRTANAIIQLWSRLILHDDSTGRGECLGLSVQIYPKCRVFSTDIASWTKR